MTGRPMMGLKTHPLSQHAIGILGSLARVPYIMELEINPGVRHRLTVQEELAETIDVPNPYRTKSPTAKALRITEAGIQRLKDVL